MDKKRKTGIKSIKNVSLIILSMCFVSSCYYDNKEELYENINFPDDCDEMGVTYDMDIELIIYNNCLQCHSHQAGQFPILSTKTDLQIHESKVKERINKLATDVNIMPPFGPMTICNIKKVNEWYRTGTP